MASLSANWVTLIHYFVWPIAQQGGVCMIVTLHAIHDCAGTTQKVIMLLKVNCLITCKYYYILCMYISSIHSVDVGHLGYFFLLIVTRVTVNMSKYLNSVMFTPLSYGKEWYSWGMW